MSKDYYVLPAKFTVSRAFPLTKVRLLALLLKDMQWMIRERHSSLFEVLLVLPRSWLRILRLIEQNRIYLHFSLKAGADSPRAFPDRDSFSFPWNSMNTTSQTEHRTSSSHVGGRTAMRSGTEKNGLIWLNKPEKVFPSWLTCLPHCTERALLTASSVGCGSDQQGTPYSLPSVSYRNRINSW